MCWKSCQMNNYHHPPHLCLSTSSPSTFPSTFPSSPLSTPLFPPSPPSQVQYYGLIKQSTGEDWLNAKMSLSTAQPSLGGAPPTLETHTIRFKTPRYYAPMHLKSARVSTSSKLRHSAGVYRDEYDPTIEDAPSGSGSYASFALECGGLSAPPPAMEVETSEVSSPGPQTSVSFEVGVVYM